MLTTTSGLYTTTQLANLFLPFKLHLTDASGSLIKGFQFSKFEYLTQNRDIKISQGSLAWDLTLLLHAQLIIKNFSADKLFIQYSMSNSSPTHEDDYTNLPINVIIKHLSIRETQIKAFEKTTLLNNLQFAAEFNRRNWMIKTLGFNLFDLECSIYGYGESQNPYAASINLNLQSLNRALPFFGHFDLQGNNTNYQLEGLIDGLGKVIVKGELSKGTFVNAKATWKNLYWPMSPINIELIQGNLEIDGRVSDLNIKANTQFNRSLPGELTVVSKIKNKQIELQALFHSLSEKFKTTISTDVSYKSLQKVSMNIKIQPGTTTIFDKMLPKVPFEGGEFNIAVSPTALQARGKFIFDKNKQLQAIFKIPKFNLQDPFNEKYSINGKLNVFINSLNFIQYPNDIVKDVQGQLLMNLSLSGKLKRPQLQGKITLKDGSVFVPMTGLRYGPIQTTLYTVDKNWRAKGSIMSGSSVISISGQGELSPALGGKIDIIGNQFPFMKTDEFDITITPKLVLNIDPHDLTITGSVDIPRASIKQKNFDNVVELSDDVIFIEKDKFQNNYRSPGNIAANVVLTLGKNVAIDIKKIKGMLDGAITIKKEPGNAITAFGNLTTRNAKYSAYGQELSIEQAQLLFTGGPIDNPGINARAIRKFNSSGKFSESNQLFNFSSANLDPIDLDKKFTVGIQVSGRLKSTEVTLFSIPANLSQADILSLLILGKPINKANKAGYQVLVSALSSLGLGSSSKGGALMEQIKEKTGIDVSLESHTSYNYKTNQSNDKTSVVIKKNLSKRIILSYNIGLLGSDNNVLVLKYLLNKFFSIQVNSTDAGNSIDVVYSN